MYARSGPAERPNDCQMIALRHLTNITGNFDQEPVLAECSRR